jgi:DNA-binding NtrC family response regulator
MSRGTVRERIERHLTGLIAAATLGGVSYKDLEDILRRRIIRAALREYKCMSRAAAELGIGRDTLRERMLTLNIPLSSRSIQKAAANRKRRAA